MRRKITQKARDAWVSCTSAKLGNTRVRGTEELRLYSTNPNKRELYLYGYRIAWQDSDGRVFFSLCGWNTTTTRERLSAIGVQVKTKLGTPYMLRGGEWVEISSTGAIEI